MNPSVSETEQVERPVWIEKYQPKLKYISWKTAINLNFSKSLGDKVDLQQELAYCPKIYIESLFQQHQRTYFNEILFVICSFSFKKAHLKMSSAGWQPFCLWVNVWKMSQFNTLRPEQNGWHFTNIWEFMKVVFVIIYHCTYGMDWGNK